MRDVETRLREYFDAAVERVTAEDVLAGRQVTERVRRRRQPWALRPAWAAVAAFVATVVVLGGATVVGIALRRPALDVGSAEIPEAVDETAAAGISWWLVIGAIAVAIACIVALIVKNRQVRAKKERTMAMTTETTQRERLETRRQDRSRRYLITALAVVVLLAAGVGAWLILGDAQTAEERDIIALLDDYSAAWEANDGAAVVALMTDDAAVRAGNGVTYFVDRLERLVENVGPFTSERLGDPIIIERSPAPGITVGWFVAEAASIDTGNGPDPVLDLFRIVERDGRFLIAYHETWRGGQ